MFRNLLAKIGGALGQAGVPYMVIGGQAVLVHGEPRLTRDIDITVGLDNSHLKQILALIISAGLRPAVAEPEPFVQRTNVLPAVEDSSGIRVGMIFSFTPYEAQAISRAIVRDMAGVSVHFAAVEDLITHKLMAGRPRDIEDIRAILAKRPVINEPYLQRWLPSFSEITGRDLLAEYTTLRARLGAS